METSKKELRKYKKRISMQFFGDKNQDEFLNGEIYFEQIIKLMHTPFRTINDNKILVNFLLSLTEFSDLIKSKVEDYMELVSHLSLVMLHEQYIPNSILFKTGEIGEKYYLILKGKVGILIPKDEILELTEEEYILYLVNLRKNEEFELLNRCILNNKNLLPGYDMQDFDKWLLKYQDNVNKRKTSKTNTEYLNELNTIFELLSNSKDFGKNTFIRRISKNIIQDTNSKDMFWNQIKIEEYIERIKPKFLNNRGENKIRFNIYNYILVTTLGAGKHFGDLALISQGGKRSATIITMEECHFGVLDKDGFDNCLKSVNEKEMKNKLQLITSLSIFNGFSRGIFKKKYLNLFVSVSLPRGGKLMIEGENADKVFVLKEGEFEIKFRKSLIELNDYISSFGGKLNIRDENDLMTEDERFKLFMKEKRNFRLAIVNKVDILGLGDMTYNNYNMFTVEVNSNKGEFFFLEKKFFKSMCYDPFIKTKTEELLINKKTFTLDRLITLKKLKIDMYKDMYNIKGNSSHLNIFKSYRKSMAFKPLFLNSSNNANYSILSDKKNTAIGTPVNSGEKKMKIIDKKKFGIDNINPNNDIILPKLYESAEDVNKNIVVSENSSIVIHKIKKRENSNIVDFLAMDSINKNLKSSSIDFHLKKKFEFFDHFVIRSPTNIINNNKKSKLKNSYYSNVSKMNVLKKIHMEII